MEEAKLLPGENKEKYCVIGCGKVLSFSYAQHGLFLLPRSVVPAAALPRRRPPQRLRVLRGDEVSPAVQILTPFLRDAVLSHLGKLNAATVIWS